MKTVMFPALIAALMILAACESQKQPEPAIDPAPELSNRTGEIAGDKTMMADVMHRSFEKGTFDDALRMAMADSTLAAAVINVIRDDPRFAAMFNAASPSQPSRGTTVSRSSSSTRSSTAKSGDVLDKTERTMQKANEKLDQAERVKKQVEEAKRKTEGILRPR